MEREHGDVRQRSQLEVERGRAHERHRGLRRVVRVERARRARSLGIAIARLDAHHARDVLARHGARAQQHRRAARQVDDGRLEPDLARAAVEDEEPRAELVADMIGRGRAHVAEAIRRRRRDRPAADARECPQELLRHRVRRAAQSHRVLAAGHCVGNDARLLHDDRQGSGPELFRERERRGRRLMPPFAQGRDGGDVHDQRMIGGAALQREDLRDGLGIRRIGAEAVDRLRRKRDHLARHKQPQGLAHVKHCGQAFFACLRSHGSMTSIRNVPFSRSPIIQRRTSADPALSR